MADSDKQLINKQICLLENSFLLAKILIPSLLHVELNAEAGLKIHDLLRAAPLHCGTAPHGVLNWGFESNPDMPKRGD